MKTPASRCLSRKRSRNLPSKKSLRGCRWRWRSPARRNRFAAARQSAQRDAGRPADPRPSNPGGVGRPAGRFSGQGHGRRRSVGRLGDGLRRGSGGIAGRRRRYRRGNA
ncbi:MAG TPA: hypothetical protein DDY78_17770 [Planctomycetales bacterium]|nr:hypothetical protein [Planctomycetales bacterium]